VEGCLSSYRFLDPIRQSTLFHRLEDFLAALWPPAGHFLKGGKNRAECDTHRMVRLD
jgi:hypothetical protein